MTERLDRKLHAAVGGFCSRRGGWPRSFCTISHAGLTATRPCVEPDTEIIYKCTDYYAPECDGAVRFDDPEIGIDWGTDTSNAVLSEKDAAAPLLKDFDSPFTFEDSQA